MICNRCWAFFTWAMAATSFLFTLFIFGLMLSGSRSPDAIACGALRADTAGSPNMRTSIEVVCRHITP